MGQFDGKKGIIMGVANQKSIATAVAKTLHKEGASLGFSYFPDDTGKMEKRVSGALKDLEPAFLLPCDISKDEDITQFFDKVEQHFGKIDFLVHSIAFAALEEIRKPTLEVSRKGFLEAMDASAYSLIAAAQRASSLMEQGGSICAMTYFGGEKVIPGYNLMGVCKSALDHSIRYLAYDLGAKGIRCNGVSAGPIRTLASSAVGDFKEMLHVNAAMSPLGQNVTADDVGRSTAYLLSDMAQAVTGEILHVDSGYHVMGAPTPRLKEHLRS